MKRYVPLAGVFLAGLLAGLAFGRRSKELPTAQHRPGPREDAAGVREMREEVLGLRRKIRDLETEKPVPGAPDRRARTAEELYRDLTDPRLHEDAKRWLRATGRLAELEPSMAPFFIAKYKEKRPHGDPLALELAVGCGGPEVVALLKEIFGDAATPPPQRQLAGISLSGTGLVAQMWPAYAPDPVLSELAGRYAGSPDPADRRGAIGLLRLQPGDASRARLQFIVSNDPDALIRMAAVVALGSAGDRSTAAFLHDYALTAAPKVFDEEDGDLTPLELALRQTLETLGRKFPE
jgi:hypothetical protein